MAHGQPGANSCQCRLIIGFPGRRLCKGDELFQFRIRQVAIHVEQRVIQFTGKLFHQALALAIQHALGLTASEQPRDHRTQTVCCNPGNRQSDFRAGFTGWQRPRQVVDQQLTGGAGLDARQALGVFGQLIAAGGQQFSSHNLAAQRRLEKGQCGNRVWQVVTHLLFGAPVHCFGGKAQAAVIDQGLINRRRQVIAIALLGGSKGINKMRALFWPPGSRKQIIEVICPCG